MRNYLPAISISHRDRVALAMGLALYLSWPLLTGRFSGFDCEQNLFQSFLVNFSGALGRFELPLWNEHVGSGYPAIYFGQYPLNHTALYYGLFGYSPLTYALLRFCNLSILFFTYFYVGLRLGYGAFVTALGALTYFSINWAVIWILPDTLSSMVILLPAVFFLLVENVRSGFRSRRDLLLYYLAFVFWASGGNVAFLFMPAAVLAVTYVLCAGLLYPVPLRRAALFFLYLIVFPWVAVAGQVYFVYEVISASNRIQPGLVVPISAPEPLLQFLRSLADSSYFWMLSLGLSVRKLVAAKSGREKLIPALFLGLLLAFAVVCRRLHFEPCFFGDYLTSLGSPGLQLAILLFSLWGYVFHRQTLRDTAVRWRLFVLFSMISCLLLSPANNPAFDGKGGLDYRFFMEYPLGAQVAILFCIALSVLDRRHPTFHRLLICDLLVLYFSRSHLTILLLRYTGIVWYGVRDGILFSVFFSLLAMSGATVLAGDLKGLFLRRFGAAVEWSLGAVLGISLLIVFAGVVRHKLFLSSVNQYARQIEGNPTAQRELRDSEALQAFFRKLRADDREFYRVSTPGMSKILLPGGLQGLGLDDASLYDSTIPREIDHFFREVVMGIPPRAGDLRATLPCSLFPKHVHSGFQLLPGTILYQWDYLFDGWQKGFIKKDNLRFWWDLSQVKYVVLSQPELYESLKLEGDPAYERIADFEDSSIRVYQSLDGKARSRWGILQLGPRESPEQILRLSNSDDIEAMKAIYRRVVPLDGSSGVPFVEQRPRNSLVSVEVDAPCDALLVDFESWNRRWELEVNGHSESLPRAFQLFRAVPIKKGKTIITLEYKQTAVRLLLALGVLSVFLNLLVLCSRGEQGVEPRFTVPVDILGSAGVQPVN